MDPGGSVLGRKICVMPIVALYLMKKTLRFIVNRQSSRIFDFRIKKENVTAAFKKMMHPSPFFNFSFL